MILSKNPYTGETLQEHREFTSEDINTTLEKAQSTFKKWKKTNFSERAQLMLKASEELKKNKREYAETMSLEMGKPISQAIAEVEK
ncbi:MAG: aldehyde dehydrogenase family protein, partial [Salinimicrobium sp.]